MNLKVKICGIKSPELIDTCINAGADYVGFVHFPKSPRHLDMVDIANLTHHASGHIHSVVLTVNPTQSEVSQISNLNADYIQLHGKETPEYCQNIKNTTNLKVIKAISVENETDIQAAKAYENCVDILLFDSKPVKGAELPGGNGQAFNWNLLLGQKFNCQTILAGGLNASNVNLAMQQSGIIQVDVSSEVEITRGNKDKALVEAFIQSAKGKK